MATSTDVGDLDVAKISVPTYEYKGVNTKVFHVGSFGKLWGEKLNPDYFSLQENAANSEEAEDAAFAEEVGISADVLEEVKFVCSLDTLRCHPENESPDTEVVGPNPSLQTLRVQKRKQDYRETLTIDKTCRSNIYASEMECVTERKRPADPEAMVAEGEIILSINIVYPVIFKRFRKHRQHQTMRVLGSQKLTELRDSICCVSDLQVSGEFSNMPDLAPEHINKDHYKSAFFFFEGVFYNDMRYPECRDLSQTILDWAQNHYTHDKLQAAKMEEATFNDLKIKIGFPYLYCHQGDCEHIIIITDIRVAHRDDCLDKTLYPVITKKHWVQTRKCSVCNMYIPRWVTSKDCFAPMDPCFFCDKCFRMLHYDTHGNKLGEFLAYPYVDPGTFN
nr:PREDICTED: snRNA-activating protein complex subunit 3 isoform X1 [Lepisosteus oculatus]